MALPDSAADYWRDQQKVTAATLAVAQRLWRRMGADFDSSWLDILPMLVATMERAQQRSVTLADSFVGDVLAEQGIDIEPGGRLVPESLVGVSGGGVPLESALYGSVIRTKAAVARGADTASALSTGGSWLQMLAQTILSDTGRAAESVGVATRPGVGYVRMLNPPSCDRCTILAGRFYRYSSGFLRHPRCDCRHVASTQKVARELTVDPNRYFESLSREAQDKTFGAAGAQAIRDGADMAQVVNAAKGMRPAQVYGQNLSITTEGVTKRGVAGKIIRARGRNPVTTPRLMPSSIYEIAESRDDAIRLLRLNGYVVNREGVPVSGVGSRIGLANIGAPVRATRVVPPSPPPPAVARVLTEATGRTLGVDTWRDYAESVDSDSASLVRVYTGNGYEDINEALRAGDTTLLSRTKRETVDALDRIIAAAPRVPETVGVSRAVGANVFGLSNGVDLAAVIGKRYVDDAFMSTAFQSRLSRLDRHEVELRLDVPTGTPGLYVSSHEDGNPQSLAAFGPDENELILGRGTAYEITDAFEEDGRRVLVGRIVSEDR